VAPSLPSCEASSLPTFASIAAARWPALISSLTRIAHSAEVIFPSISLLVISRTCALLELIEACKASRMREAGTARPLLAYTYRRSLCDQRNLDIYLSPVRRTVKFPIAG
jgi:hypothetical protein